MTKIKSATFQRDVRVPFFNYTSVCSKGKGASIFKFKPCDHCNGSGQIQTMWVTDTDKENKIVGFIITHNGKEYKFPVVKDILQAFKKAELQFSKLKF
jgi:hypothetical protein